MYDYKPPRGNSNAKMAALLCFLASVVAFVGAALVPKFPSVLQCIGLILLVPVIQITARYLILQYLYRLRAIDGGGVDFEVYAYRGGARMQLVCRIGLAEITAVKPLSEENRTAPSGLRRYNYHPDMRPRAGTVLSITNGDGDCEILIAPDAHLTAVFTRAAAQHQKNQETS